MLKFDSIFFPTYNDLMQLFGMFINYWTIVVFFGTAYFSADLFRYSLLLSCKFKKQVHFHIFGPESESGVTFYVLSNFKCSLACNRRTRWTQINPDKLAEVGDGVERHFFQNSN